MLGMPFLSASTQSLKAALMEAFFILSEITMGWERVFLVSLHRITYFTVKPLISMWFQMLVHVLIASKQFLHLSQVQGILATSMSFYVVLLLVRELKLLVIHGTSQMEKIMFLHMFICSISCVELLATALLWTGTMKIGMFVPHVLVV